MEINSYMGIYTNILNILKELSSQIRARAIKARNTDGMVTLDDIKLVLESFEDKMNNNLAQYGKEIKISFIDNDDVPFEITNLQNRNESKRPNKKLIKLTESDIHNIVKESVYSVVKNYEKKK